LAAFAFTDLNRGIHHLSVFSAGNDGVIDMISPAFNVTDMHSKATNIHILLLMSQFTFLVFQNTPK
jgi:hypothetical protein